jgi:hypothetical protein
MERDKDEAWTDNAWIDEAWADMAWADMAWTDMAWTDTAATPPEIRFGDNEIVLVMGVTGCGKSSFITTLAEANLDVPLFYELRRQKSPFL